MKENDIYRMDANLYEAIKRREQKLPSIPTNLNDRLMQRVHQQKSKHRHLWLYPTIGAVAASVLLLLTLHYHDNNVETEKKPVMVQRTEPRDKTKKTEEKKEVLTTIPETILVAQTRRVSSPTKHLERKAQTVQQEPTDIAVEDIVPANKNTLPSTDIVEAIPPDRQALADIYLAETALQVAYERLAQTEELKAYTICLEVKENESSRPIVAF